MASSAGTAPSTPFLRLQTRVWRGCTAVAGWIERQLERERDQLPVWIPVALGSGIAAWFILPDARRWLGFIAVAAGLALAGLALGRGGRAGRVLAIGGVLAAAGCLLVWARADHVSAPVLAREGMVRFEGVIRSVEAQPARELTRLVVAPEPGAGLPPRVRINVRDADMPEPLGAGERIAARAWLMPPPRAGVPGAYDFARVAWFARIGATGRALGPVRRIGPAMHDPLGSWRARLAAHVRERVGGSAGAIAATLATGDRGAISDEDAEAMRRSGLAHLLSISGLHVTAVVGTVMILVLRLLALWPWLALRVRLPLVAAGMGALAAIGYTVMTGAQVPTLRSCIAALLVLAALATGREAITLRLIATGALLVLLAWPETLAGPSFQLSFAAVVAIVALHESGFARQWFARREEPWFPRVARGIGSLVLTGLVVEVALAPIALFHFHKSGLYGALANIVAIPLSTFVIMPVEALALLFDTVGLGAPFWWLTRHALDLLLALAHFTAGLPGAVAALPTMPQGAFALMVAGGLWLAIWRARWRLAGLAPILGGALWAFATPSPDLLVTGDGRHLAVADGQGGYALLRPRAGDYVRAMLGESAGLADELSDVDTLPGATCGPDSCWIERVVRGRRWRVLATRSGMMLEYRELSRACARADIVVSDRRLPDGCRPIWLKLDKRALAKSGGVAIRLGDVHLSSVIPPGDRHPWVDPPRISPPRAPKAGTAKAGTANPGSPEPDQAQPRADGLTAPDAAAPIPTPGVPSQ